MRFDKVFKSPFARDERGVTAIIFGLTIIPVIGLMGLALDGWRAFNAASMTMGALDSSALAAAKGMATENLSEEEAKELHARHASLVSKSKMGVFTTTTHMGRLY